MCGVWSEADEPLIFLQWSGRTVEALRLGGSRLFVCDTALHNCISVRQFKAYIAGLWNIPQYRVHLSVWVNHEGEWKPTVLTIRGEWLRWRRFECDITRQPQWVCGDGYVMLGPSYAISYLTYWIFEQALSKRPWYFVCEHCQVRVRCEFPAWSYDNIDEDGDPWSDRSESDWSDTDAEVALVCPAPSISRPPLSLMDMYAPCTCEQSWFSSGWRCPHVGDAKVAQRLVSNIIGLKRELKLSSAAKWANCTAEYDRAEASIKALQRRIIALRFLLNDEEVFDRAWDAVFDRKVEVCVYTEVFEGLPLQFSVSSGSTVGALKDMIQKSGGFVDSLQQFSCCVADPDRAIMRDEDHVGQWDRGYSEPLNVRLCNMGSLRQ